MKFHVVFLSMTLLFSVASFAKGGVVERTRHQCGEFNFAMGQNGRLKVSALSIVDQFEADKFLASAKQDTKTFVVLSAVFDGSDPVNLRYAANTVESNASQTLKLENGWILEWEYTSSNEVPARLLSADGHKVLGQSSHCATLVHP